MLVVHSSVPASQLSTMRAGGIIPFVLDITEPKDLVEAVDFAKKNSLPLVALGGGSNTLFGDGTLPYILARIKIPGIEILRDDTAGVTVRCGAGVAWDELVAWSVAQGLSGIELLSWIPGTVGAAPVQNIGAYGAEFSNVTERVDFFDTASNTFSHFSAQECGFEYRMSIFKKEPRTRFVTHVTINLTRGQPSKIQHPEILRELESATASSPTLDDIRKAVIAVRTRKLPDPNITPNCGSFFMNPIVASEQAEHIKKEFSAVPMYPQSNGIKLSAGWLIEQAGYKGCVRGHVGTHANHALVLINHGTGTGEDIRMLAQEITEAVFNRFGVSLVPEVQMFF